jgi:hypothetical protein
VLGGDDAGGEDSPRARGGERALRPSAGASATALPAPSARPPSPPGSSSARVQTDRPARAPAGGERGGAGARGVVGGVGSEKETYHKSSPPPTASWGAGCGRRTRRSPSAAELARRRRVLSENALLVCPGGALHGLLVTHRVRSPALESARPAPQLPVGGLPLHGGARNRKTGRIRSHLLLSLGVGVA